MTTTTNTPTDVARTYFEAWKTKDFDLYRSILADDVTFDGPMGHETNADDCTNAFKGLANATTEVVVHKVFVDGPDVVTFFDLHVKDAVASPVVNWSHVEDGKIAWIRVVFDPRPLLSG